MDQLISKPQEKKGKESQDIRFDSEKTKKICKAIISKE